MKTSLKLLLVFLVFLSTHTLKAQTGNCNLVNSFISVDTTFCETIFYPDVYDANYSYSWDFGDGNTSFSAYSTNQYSNPGTYTVTLIVSDSVCSDTLIQSVIISQCTMPCMVYASFYTYDSACYTGFQPSPYNTSFTYLWDFGDGNTSTELDPMHLYNTTGSYNVSLIISDGNCSDTITTQITSSNCPPPCTFSADFYDYDSSCYTGFSPSPQNNSYSYSWDFGDGNSSSSIVPQHLYANQGNYNVTLIMSDGTCVDTIVKNISSASCNTPCSITADFYDYDTSCYTGFYPSPLSTPNTPYSYYWDFGDGNTSSVMIPEHLYANQGNYNVTLVVFNGICADTITKTISSASCNPPCNLDASFTANETSPFTYTFTPNTINSSNSYAWYFGDGSTSNNAISTHTYLNANTYPVMMVVSDSLCSEIDTMFISVIDSSSNLNSSFNYTLESDGSYTFAAHHDISNYDSFVWNFGDNTTSTAISPNHMYSSNGNYMILLTVVDGNNTSTDTLNLIINSLNIDYQDETTFELQLYPNPASEIVNLEFTTDKSENLEISIVDFNGKILTQESFTAVHGENTKEININALSKGVYHIILKPESGSTIKRIRLVKQ